MATVDERNRYDRTAALAASTKLHGLVGSIHYAVAIGEREGLLNVVARAKRVLHELEQAANTASAELIAEREREEMLTP